MERSHKIICLITLVSTFTISYLLKLDFEPIASDSISVISIVLAIYTISISSLIGNDFTYDLYKKVHNEMKDCTHLDIFIKYLKNSAYIAIITIILSMLKKLNFSILIYKIYKISFLKNILIYIDIFQIYSSICFSVLSLNFVFVLLVIKFIINRQLRNK